MNRRSSLPAVGAMARAMLKPTFWAGALAGGGLMLSFWPTASPSSIAATEVVRVKGEASEAPGYARVGSTEPSEAREVASSSRELSPRQVARRALASTVFVKGGGMYGAGVAISSQHVLTCLHVVENLHQVEVSLEQGPTAQARVVERDERLDLAVLEVEPSMGLEPARLVSASTAHMGDVVYAMGAPRKMSFSFSAGMQSYVGRSYDGVHYLQADLTSNSGSSGGPWLDAHGRVIGVSSFILRDSQGLAFGLPVDYAYLRFTRYFADRLESDAFDRWLESRRVSQPATGQQR